MGSFIIAQVAGRIILLAWRAWKSRDETKMKRIQIQRNLLKAFHEKRYLEKQKISSRERREKQVRKCETCEKNVKHV